MVVSGLCLKSEALPGNIPTFRNLTLQMQCGTYGAATLRPERKVRSKKPGRRFGRRFLGSDAKRGAPPRNLESSHQFSGGSWSFITVSIIFARRMPSLRCYGRSDACSSLSQAFGPSHVRMLRDHNGTSIGSHKRWISYRGLVSSITVCCRTMVGHRNLCQRGDFGSRVP